MNPHVASIYVPLWCKSNFSFLDAASDPAELVEEARHLGLRSLALSDRDGVYGIVQAHLAAKEKGLHLIVGSEVTVVTEVDTFQAPREPRASRPQGRVGESAPGEGNSSRLVLLAQDRRGYANLCRLLTKGRLRSPKGESRVTWPEVCEHAEGLIALWGGDRSLLAWPGDDVVGAIHPHILDEVAGLLKEAFGDRLYGVITRHLRADEIRQERRLRERATQFELRLVAAVEVLYHSPGCREVQDVLCCIRNGVKLSDAGRSIRANAEYSLLSHRAFMVRFNDDPVAAARTLEVAERCTFSLDEIRYRYPSERLPDGTTTSEWLRRLTFEGARQRYLDHALANDSEEVERSGENGGVPLEVVAQLNKELMLIDELDYGGYFLTMYEIVRFCKELGILCQWRGSAANSAVCYCLEITAIDPVRMGLLFERFISKERAEPPDIDLDIEHERREEVIQHVYEKYGRSHAAMVATIIRYRAKSAVRDVGKALGLAETSLDRLSKMINRYDSIGPEALAQAGLDPYQPVHQHLMRIASEIQGFPRHLSIHPGGFLLGHEPVHDLVPIENGTMEDRTVIQWEKDDVEAIGLFKVDLLGLGALTQLHRCFDQLKEGRDIDLEMATIPSQDEPTFDMVCKADTVGVFQIESRAQMAMLTRLKPRKFYDLVVEVSIVRPGPITGGMVHHYLRRRAGKEPVEYPHECLVPVLEKTLGVPLFQEQVMRLAVVAADYTPGEADQLRRDMAAWRKTGRLERHRGRLISRMVDKGIQEEFAERVFEQIRGFGEYGFPESHAASFALISYATAYLKHYYLPEFTCSLLNSQPIGFYSPATIVGDAKRHGLVVHPVDVNYSHWDCTLELCEESEAVATRANALSDRRSDHSFALRMGLRYIKGLREDEGERIEKIVREAQASSSPAGSTDDRTNSWGVGFANHSMPFQSFEEFTDRTRISERSLRLLAEAGAFESLSANRRTALWRVKGLASDRIVRDETKTTALSLPDESPASASLNAIETVTWDYTRMSHSTRAHLLEPFREQLRANGLPDAQTVARMPDGKRVKYAGVVICRQRPGTASGVVFMTLEDETGFVNTIFWPSVYEKYSMLARTLSFMGVTGKVQAAEGVVHLIVDEIWDPSGHARPTKVQSRDFH